MYSNSRAIGIGMLGYLGFCVLSPYVGAGSFLTAFE